MSQPLDKRARWLGFDKAAAKGWVADVMRTSDALSLEPGVFTHDDPTKIAKSLKRSADRDSDHPFSSAMSMLNFHINRSGKNLSSERREVLNQAKDELRRLYKR